MKSFTPLWSMIVYSSLWDEEDFVIKVFMTMLALKDSDHVYRGTAYQLGVQSRKSETEVLDALKVLSSPDTGRKEAQEHDGKRIRGVEDGWLILNGEKYRGMMKVEMERARWRRAQARKRELGKLKGVRGKPLAGETAAVKACERGDALEAERLAEPNSA